MDKLLKEESPIVNAGNAALDIRLRLRLSAMMFLQYATWGAWWVVLAIYIKEIGFTPEEIGRVFATTAIASMFSPLFFGQIADRWVPTQYLLAVLHLGAGGALFLATRYTSFWPFYICVLTWSLLYIPTISLTNSLSFHQIPDADKHFPGIRVFGTIGWIVAGWMVGLAGLDEGSTQPILFAGGIAVILGFYCLFLPHTPPSGKAGDTLPPLKALGLLRDGNFVLFIGVSFIISVILAGYFVFTSVFLSDAPLKVKNVAPLMTVGQCAEIIFLIFLPFFLKRLGMKWTLTLGIGAWGLRYAIFSCSHWVWLAVIGIALHGICYDFFFVASYIHTDNQAAKDIRASAQALFNFVTMGVGMFLGSELFGHLVGVYTENEVTDWTRVWAYPALASVVVLAIFILFFKEKRKAVDNAGD